MNHIKVRWLPCLALALILQTLPFANAWCQCLGYMVPCSELVTLQPGQNRQKEQASACKIPYRCLHAWTVTSDKGVEYIYFTLQRMLKIICETFSIAFCPPWLDISNFLVFCGVSAVCISCKIFSTRIVPPSSACGHCHLPWNKPLAGGKAKKIANSAE